jgi:hypothetical protein
MQSPAKLPPDRAGWPDRLAAAALRPCPLWQALAVSLLIGCLHTALFLPLSVVLGRGPFWVFPVGTVPGSLIDMAQALSGYLALVQTPWALPLLHVPGLAPPAGVNVFWLDAVPWVALLGRLVFTVTGAATNLLGGFLALCWILPGAAMTLLLRAAGQRGLATAAAGAVLVDAAPMLLFEWGHIALCAQCLLIFALALYRTTLRRAAGARPPAAWLLLLSLALLTHVYLFAMVGGIWLAALAQQRLSAGPSRTAAAQPMAALLLILALMGVTGMLSGDLAAGGTRDFGVFSMNLGSPLVPQLSGAIPPLHDYWIGGRSQVFGWTGLGAWLVVLAGLPGLLRGWRGRLRRHAVLAVVLAGYGLFALSNRITLGSHVLLTVPLPAQLAWVLGTFRASGRFFWPIGYAAIAMGVLGVLRAWRPPLALAILAGVAVVQTIDAAPVRARIAATTSQAYPAVVDRAAATAAIEASQAVMVFPTAGCFNQGGNPAHPDYARLQAAVELELIAVRANRPVNSVVRPRLTTDCAAERAEQGRPLRPDTAYFYLAPFTPAPFTPAPLTSASPVACQAAAGFTLCRRAGMDVEEQHR